MKDLKVEVLQMHPQTTNSIVISSGNDCIVFDAWGNTDDWDRFLTSNNLHLYAIYSTHGHFDHISAAPALAKRHSIPWHLNHRDLSLIPWGNQALQNMDMAPIPDDYDMPIDLPTGELEVLPGLFANVIEIPGHSAGGVAFLFLEQNLLLIGDTLFQESIGRYDLPGASATALQHSIMKIYDMNLSDNMVVIHGHGADSTIGDLKQNNPYFNGSDDACDECKCGNRCNHSHGGGQSTCCGGGENCQCHAHSADATDCKCDDKYKHGHCGG